MRAQDALTGRAMIDGHLLASRVEVARTFLRRAIGLLGRSQIAPDTLLWIQPASSIHTIGMKFAIDVVFLDRQNRIVKAAWAVSPGRVVLGGFGAYSVLEAATGWMDPAIIRPGAQVTFESSDATAIPS